jgi:NAD(P)H-nitrite reductase
LLQEDLQGRLPFDNGYENVNYMWTMKNAEHISNSVEDSEKAVVVGGGLLGIDLAVAYAENDCETYYLIRESNWWSRGLDQKGAEIIHRKLEQKGVNIMTQTECTDFETEGDNVSAAVLGSGDKIECDAVAVAIGQTPNSEFVDVEKNDHNMIKTDKFLQTSDKDVYAAGNMVEYYSPVFERRTVNGSWDHSGEMGKYAAKNMLNKGKAFNYVNTYGVGHFDVQFLSIGDFTGEPIQRKYGEDEYRRLFFDGDRLVGAVMIGYTKGQEKIKDLIQEKKQFENREKLLKKSFWE